MRGPQAAHNEFHDTGPILPPVHVALPVESNGGLRVTLTAAGLAAAAAIVAYAVIANKNAGDAAADVKDHTPRIVKIETKVENMERDVGDIKADVKEILRRTPPK